MEFGRVDNTKGEPPAEVAEHFQGSARLQRLSSPFADGPDVFAVHFDAGGRTKPHTHKDGQLLVIASGKGIIGGRGGRQVVEAGDVVAVMPGEWHWHGATPSAPMTHVTVQMSGPDSIDWDVDEGNWASGYEEETP
ncbi:MAG: cupin domain-containing protein [Actinomycetota bacterium]|nr:cupin domain-containing protein [Actinomycetota bacterium]